MDEVLQPSEHVLRDADSVKGAGKDDLIQHLDDLLERYLNTLDEYDKVSKELSKQLSSGYMSLAQANFHNSSSTIRYGRDCYDERMQTIRKVTISEKSANSSKDSRISFSINPDQNHVSGTPDSESMPENSPKADDESLQQNSNEKHDPPSDSAKPTDPLRWFGILVPPALRTAQSTFVAAVEGSVPQLASVARELRRQEMEIGRVRKQIKKL